MVRRPVLLLGFILVGTLAFGQSVRLKDFIIESPSPVWGDLFVFPPNLSSWGRESRPSLGPRAGFLTMEYIRSQLEIPFAGVIQGQNTVYLPSQGLLQEEKRLLFSILSRLGSGLTERKILFLDRIGTPGSSRLDPGWTPDKLPESGTFSLDIELEEGRWSMEGKILQRVPVLARDVSAGDQLGPGDFTLRYQEQASPWDGDLNGFYTARADFSSGKVLSAAVLNPFYHVKSGESVRVILRKGALEVHMVGTSLENGNPGNNIRIRSGWDSSEYQGKILRTREVLVEIP